MNRVSKGKLTGFTLGFIAGLLADGFLGFTWLTSNGWAVMWAIIGGIVASVGSRGVRMLDSQFDDIGGARAGFFFGLCALAAPFVITTWNHEFTMTGWSGASKILFWPLSWLVSFLFVSDEFILYEILSPIAGRFANQGQAATTEQE